MITWKSVSSRTITTALVFAIVLIVPCLSAAYHAVLEAERQRKLEAEIPWYHEGDRPEDSVKNRDKYFQAQLDSFNQNFPKGASLEKLELAARQKGFHVGNYCRKPDLEKTPSGGGCENLINQYANIDITYNVFYDENHRIVSIEMGPMTEWK